MHTRKKVEPNIRSQRSMPYLS